VAGKARVSALVLINQQPGLEARAGGARCGPGTGEPGHAGAQQLIVLRLLEMVQTGVAFVSGIAFGLAGLATSAAAIGYTRISQRLGYVKTAAAASGLLALAVLLTGVAPTSLLVVVAAGLMGLFGGVVLLDRKLLGLEMPRESQSIVFGINAARSRWILSRPADRRHGRAATLTLWSALYVIAGCPWRRGALSTQAREPLASPLPPGGCSYARAPALAHFKPFHSPAEKAPASPALARRWSRTTRGRRCGPGSAGRITS
jgi:hypothetical protein